VGADKPMGIGGKEGTRDIVRVRSETK
jgi:hypothetical protein